MYTANDIKIVGKTYQTTDGKYKTITESPSFFMNEGKKVLFKVGYTYWFEDDIKLGSTSYDFLFFIDKEGINIAVDVLNRVIAL